MAYQTLSCKAAGQYDHKVGAKYALTGWGKVCKARQEQKISRKARRKGGK